MKLTEMTITKEQQKDIEVLIETKVTHILGGRKSNANKNTQIRFKLAVEFLHDFYEFFNITGYSELKVSDSENIKQYIMEWFPTVNLKREIASVNSCERRD